MVWERPWFLPKVKRAIDSWVARTSGQGLWCPLSGKGSKWGPLLRRSPEQLSLGNPGRTQWPDTTCTHLLPASKLLESHPWPFTGILGRKTNAFLVERRTFFLQRVFALFH